MFVAEPHWLPEAYEQALNVFDTGAVARNVSLSRVLAAVLYLHCGPTERYLDFAGGYGLLTRMMRDVGFDYFWEDAHAENLFARGFEADAGARYAAISAFEVLEHLTDPVADVARLADRSDTLVFSTELWSDHPPLPEEWRYFGFEHGQHVMFYSRKTLEYLARTFGYRLMTDGSGLHVFTRRPDPRGMCEQIVSSRRAWRWLVAGVNGLRLPPLLLTGPRLSATQLHRAVTRSMSSRTLADHDMLRRRFREADATRRGTGD